MQLDPAARAAGFRLATFETLQSTNTEALALARRGEQAPLWITARRQTAGRGRRGSTWVSPPGNLYATLLLYDPAPPELAAQSSFVAALAVYDAIRQCAHQLGDKLALKWPNDVLCGSAKLAGILLESESLRGSLALAIGIGVNCLHHPAHTSYPATDLAAVGADVSAEQVFFSLSAAMLRRLAQWQRGARFAAVRAAWLDRAVGIGEAVRVRLPDREMIGRFEALDAQGRLLLRLDDGSLQAIDAGEVFLCPPRGEPAGGATTGCVH